MVAETAGRVRVAASGCLGTGMGTERGRNEGAHCGVVVVGAFERVGWRGLFGGDVFLFVKLVDGRVASCTWRNKISEVSFVILHGGGVCETGIW